ncbi:MAG: cadherin-like beta sandwich domain-containing protein [Spirochaetota bacterium]
MKYTVLRIVLFLLVTCTSSCVPKKEVFILQNFLQFTALSSSEASTSDLLSLSVDSGSLSPTFSSTTYEYTISVENTTSSIVLTPTSTNGSETIAINGVSVSSGSTSDAISLSVGSNTVSIIVNSGSSTSTYTITVTRAADASLTSLILSSGTISPDFSSSTTSYSTTVGNSVSSLTVTPTVTDSSSTVTVDSSSVASGSASSSISLSVGTNTITVVVTASDSSTTTYSVTVTRSSVASSDSSLSALVVNSGTLYPTFASATTSYATTIPNSDASITITPTGNDTSASVTVDGSSVTSGSASSGISLSVGSNTITVVVTAQDSSTTTYTITATRLSVGVKRMYLTATSYDGNLGGVTGADTKCASDAYYPGSGTFKAMLQDDSGGTRRAVATIKDWVLAASTTYVRNSDGVTIFTTNANRVFDYTAGNAQASFDSGAQKEFWTGGQSNWNPDSDLCSNYSLNTNASDARVGLTDSVTTDAINSSNQACDEVAHLLCVEQ